MVQLELSEIKGGWAVHGATKEEAMQRFEAAEEMRRNIKEQATILAMLDIQNKAPQSSEEATL